MGTEQLKESLRAGHGILLTPNHCRMSDPLVMGWLARECGVWSTPWPAGTCSSRVASWAGRFTRWVPSASIAKGVDRQAINVAIEMLESAERPLIIFPEGAVSRTNDRLQALLDGVAFIARTAAKRRAKRVAGGKVVSTRWPSSICLAAISTRRPIRF